MVHSLNKDHLVYTHDKNLANQLINYLNSNGYKALSKYGNNAVMYGIWIYPNDKEFNLYHFASDVNKGADNVGSIEETYLNALRSKKLESILDEEGL